MRRRACAPKGRKGRRSLRASTASKAASQRGHWVDSLRGHEQTGGKTQHPPHCTCLAGARGPLWRCGEQEPRPGRRWAPGPRLHSSARSHCSDKTKGTTRRGTDRWYRSPKARKGQRWVREGAREEVFSRHFQHIFYNL